MKKSFLISFLILILFFQTVYGWDNSITHPTISKRAVSESIIDTYLRDKLNFNKDGVNSSILGYSRKGKLLRSTLLKHIQEGSFLEDEPNCRASNHFHDPLEPWLVSGVKDLPDIFCAFDDEYPLGEINFANSAVHWATGYYTPSPGGYKMNIDNKYDWDHARENYYQYLTREDVIIDGVIIPFTEDEREIALSETFKALGYVMHLVQDMAVPAHVRDDFMSHIDFAGPSKYTSWINLKKMFANKFEFYVKKHDELITGITVAQIPDISITKFWDTNQYVGQDPDEIVDPLTLGLAEYTNMNFASARTVFSEDFLTDSNTSNDNYYQPYPRKSSTNIQDLLDDNLLPISVTSEDGKIDHVKYISKLCDGEVINKFVKPTYFSRFIQTPAGYQERIYFDSFDFDDEINKEYATILLPRAIGYSAALLDYFFRGSLELSIPDDGIYALTNDISNPSENGFKQIKLKARNTTPDAEEMTLGTIELVVKYRLSEGDPFTNNHSATSPQFYYKVFYEQNNISTIPRGDTVELSFDLTDNEIPLWATDVYLQVVYRGKLGNEEDAIAVGFKDISEPTPIDIFNNMDKICFIGGDIEGWKDAGDPDLIEYVDDHLNGGNKNGIADEFDVYPHDLRDIYFRFYPHGQDPPAYASPSAGGNHYHIAALAGGEFNRSVYALTDYKFNYSYLASVESPPVDPWFHYDMDGVLEYDAIKNQREWNGIAYIRYVPGFKEFRGVEMWGGLKTINSSYPDPEDPDACPYEDLE